MGPAGMVHGNRGRVPSRRLDETTRRRILELGQGRYAGVHDSHLADLLAEREGITIARASLQRLLRQAGRPSTRKRRAPTQLVHGPVPLHARAGSASGSARSRRPVLGPRVVASR